MTIAAARVHDKGCAALRALRWWWVGLLTGLILLTGLGLTLWPDADPARFAAPQPALRKPGAGAGADPQAKPGNAVETAFAGAREEAVVRPRAATVGTHPSPEDSNAAPEEQPARAETVVPRANAGSQRPSASAAGAGAYPPDADAEVLEAILPHLKPAPSDRNPEAAACETPPCREVRTVTPR